MWQEFALGIDIQIVFLTAVQLKAGHIQGEGQHIYHSLEDLVISKNRIV
jgi:hypothetical protein